MCFITSGINLSSNKLQTAALNVAKFKIFKKFKKFKCDSVELNPMHYMGFSYFLNFIILDILYKL